MWKTETTQLVLLFPLDSLLVFWDDVHMYGARASLPCPVREPPTKWCCLIAGGMARWGRDSL